MCGQLLKCKTWVLLFLFILLVLGTYLSLSLSGLLGFTILFHTVALLIFLPITGLHKVHPETLITASKAAFKEKQKQTTSAFGSVYCECYILKYNTVLLLCLVKPLKQRWAGIQRSHYYTLWDLSSILPHQLFPAC